MRRNQHSAHSQGVDVGVVGSACSADVGASADDLVSQTALDPWLVRVLRLVAYILRLPTGARGSVEFSHAQAWRRVIHVACMELDREMVRQPPASDLPVVLPMQVRSVLTLAFFGTKPPDIAAQLILSPRTVSSYLRDAASQLGVSGTENAVREAFRRRLLLFENTEAWLGAPDVLSLLVDDPPQRE